jgi:hypothetical protein
MRSAADHPGWERLSATFGASRYLRGLPEHSSCLVALSSAADVDTQAMHADRGLAWMDR